VLGSRSAPRVFVITWCSSCRAPALVLASLVEGGALRLQAKVPFPCCFALNQRGKDRRLMLCSPQQMAHFIQGAVIVS
jgi:hypothetical protein